MGQNKDKERAEAQSKLLKVTANQSIEEPGVEYSPVDTLVQ